MSMTHCSCDADACRSSRMFGMATLTIVASIDTISRLRQQDTRMMPLRRALRGPREAGDDRTTVSFTQYCETKTVHEASRCGREDTKAPDTPRKRGPLRLLGR